MNQKKSTPMKSALREKLIVGLQMDDALAAVNLAMKVRGITLTLDYTNKDHLARLWVSRPGVPRQGWLLTNPRKKLCYYVHPQHPDLRAFTSDLMERLAAMDIQLTLAAEKSFNKKHICKLQLQFSGVRRIVITLMDVTKGQSKSDTSFSTPDGRIL